VDEKLIEAEKLLAVDPEKSLDILIDLEDSYNGMADKKKAFFGVVLFQALDKTHNELTPAEFIDFSIDYYSRSGQKDRLAYSYLYKARMLRNKREYAGAIEYLLQALQLSGQGKDYSLLGKISFDLAQIAGFQEEFEKTEKYCDQAINYFEKSGEKDNVAKIYLYMGWLYQSTDDFDKAIGYSQKAMHLTTDSVVIGDALNDIGSYFLSKEMFDSARYYISRSLKYPYFDTNMSTRYFNMANVYSASNKNDSASKYINMAFEYPIDIYYECECYRLLTNIAFSQNNQENISKYLAAYHSCQDSIKKLEMQPNINLLEKIHQTDIEASRIKDQRLILIVIIICLVLISGLVFLWLYRSNKKKILDMQNYRNELEKKDELLEKKHEQLEKKQELLLLELTDELKRTRAKYAEMKKKANFAQKEQIEKNIYKEVLHFDNERAFIKKMNKVLNYLPDKLKESYPDIAYKEILWCCLFMLQIPTNDISLIMDYTQSSQYKFKQRLIKKLGLKSAKELEKMLYDKVNL